ncbi:MAG: phosphate uptake regulator PhoU [Candidatus Micrarchaeota archaeon]
MENIRKIQKTGGGTYAVSLPKEWAKGNGISAGSPAFITPNSDGSLTIHTRPGSKGMARIVETGSDLENSLRKVISAYVSGADSIVVRGALAGTVCEEARSRLSALETMEENGDEVTLHVFHRGEAFTTDHVLRRMYVVVSAMFSVSRRLFETGTDVLPEVEKREHELDRMYFLALRAANRDYGSLHRALNKTLAAKALEDLADNLELACTNGRTVAPNARLRGLLEKAEAVFRTCFETFYEERFSEKQFALVQEFEERLGKEGDELMRKAHGPEKAVAMKGVLERLHSIAEYSKDLLEIGADLAEFKKPEPERTSPLARGDE